MPFATLFKSVLKCILQHFSKVFRDTHIIYDNMELPITELFASYDYHKNVKHQYTKSGRELEYYSYNAETNRVAVPLINKEATYVARIQQDKVVKFLTMHLENNKKYLLQ